MHAKKDRATWLNGPAASCSALPRTATRPYRFILLGACQLSTGDIFRAAKSRDGPETTPALKDALDAMRRGELVTDEIVLDIVRERIGCLKCGGGFLLDGFPRTVAQAEVLTRLLEGEHIQLRGRSAAVGEGAHGCVRVEHRAARRVLSKAEPARKSVCRRIT